MSETKFTPGPWEYYAYLVYAPGPNGANICAISEPRATTAVQYTRVAIGSPDSAEVVANATLIAAAPDLYAALAALIEHTDAMERSDFYGEEITEWQHTPCRSAPLIEAIAALQRARGETP